MTERETEPTKVESGRVLVMRAAGLVAVAVLLSRILGLVREVVIRATLGVETVPATAYETASRFPEAIFLIIAGGAIGSAFIPTFAEYFAREDEEGAWRLFSAVINLTVLVVTAVAILTMVFAPQFVRFFFAENILNTPDLLPLTVRLMRIMLISPIIFGVSGIVMGTLNARQHFLLPALAPSIYNLGIIGGGLLVQPTELGLAWGTVVGALGHLVIQLPGLRQKQARYSAVFTLRDPGVRKVLRLMAPRVLGLSFSEINKFIILFLTGSMPLGSLPALNSAFRLIIMPQGILGQALGIAAFPTFATLAARSALDEMRQILTDSLRIVLFLGIPTTIWLMTLRQPLVAILFQRGIFDAEATGLVAWALLFYAVGLVALTALEVIARAFYALSDTLTPVLAGGAQVLLMGVLSVWLRDGVFPVLGWQPIGGVALGLSISNFFEVGLLLWLLRRKMGGINGRSLLDGIWRMGLAGSVMALAVWLATQLPVVAANNLFQLLVGGITGGISYLSVTILLGVQEVGQFVRLVQRLRR